jgi:DNA-binding NtrC family response regulator
VPCGYSHAGIALLQKLLYIRVTSGFSTEAQRIIQAYRWQGNVRELQNAVQHALLFGDSAVIQPEDLPEYVLTQKPQKIPRPTAIKRR